MSWAVEELNEIDLGDERLNKRTHRIVEDLFDNASSSIPTACGGWAETQAAYRYFANDKVDWQKILDAHFERTAERIIEHQVVLCVQDTTELDFTGQEIEGMGRLSYDNQRGMYLHPTLMVTPAREALGVTDLWMWARGPSKAQDQAQPSICESRRWVEGYERVAELAERVPETRLVYVADRESDIAALIGRAAALGQPADWLLRSCRNRKVEGEDDKLWDGFEADHEVGSLRFTLPARHEQGSREVEQTLSVRRCRVNTPEGKTELTAILARETHPPAGVEPIEWRLITNRLVDCLEEVIELIDWYRARWEIEQFFFVLKTGCQVEALQLSAVERIERALALYVLVAWRVLRLMRLGRLCPELSCEVFFSPDEWQAAYLVARKTLPKQPPTLNEVVRVVASFGGFLGRRRDGEPGAKSLWIGLQRVMDFTIGMQALREQ
jgi:hypothetical protein